MLELARPPLKVGRVGSLWSSTVHGMTLGGMFHRMAGVEWDHRDPAPEVVGFSQSLRTAGHNQIPRGHGALKQ